MATRTAVASGDWHNAAVWDTGVPLQADTAIIAGNFTVDIRDASDAKVRQIELGDAVNPGILNFIPSPTLAKLTMDDAFAYIWFKHASSRLTEIANDQGASSLITVLNFPNNVNKWFFRVNGNYLPGVELVSAELQGCQLGIYIKNLTTGIWRELTMANLRASRPPVIVEQRPAGRDNGITWWNGSGAEVGSVEVLWKRYTDPFLLRAISSRSRRNEELLLVTALRQVKCFITDVPSYLDTDEFAEWVKLQFKEKNAP